MSERAKTLAGRLRGFSDDVIAFVEGCSKKNWKKACAKEEWPVGVTARHIGAAHFEAVDLVRMIVKGEKLPEFTMEQLVEMANEHARRHAACTREEVLGLLRRNGAALVDYVAGLSDAELDRTGHLALAGGKLSAQQLIEAVILKSGGEHFASMKAAAES
ncbi:MAG: DinB family protein [Desulfobacterales bacterium]|jgi:hypothetical protein|nr:DinB family protein [Desulfobacterales bacterium]